ncbi:hypothetical protein COLSTE_02504 [Collinsella stercoris DSM 13279]|uniref:Uncharacterized protein n=1 Tax=Collinsella stercoris DSM 13279 TaxID=445975 RepID=B6GEF9_9ACTN|nr:hypothetical protein COLSTE_02504 [Collinsella stercoris DSM 13279]
MSAINLSNFTQIQHKRKYVRGDGNKKTRVSDVLGPPCDPTARFPDSKSLPSVYPTGGHIPKSGSSRIS